jgi:hypothetical protein
MYVVHSEVDRRDGLVRLLGWKVMKVLTSMHVRMYTWTMLPACVKNFGELILVVKECKDFFYRIGSWSAEVSESILRLLLTGAIFSS